MDIFMADPHFGHQNILGFEPQSRPYADVTAMNIAIINNVNAVTSPDDTLYILGDVGFASCYWPLSQLVAKKIVIVLGNHDYPNKIEQILAANPRIKVAGALEYKSCILTHIPVHDSQLRRFRANIHGHLHGNNISDKRYICVSMEQNEMKPFTWQELVQKLPPPLTEDDRHQRKPIPKEWKNDKS